MIIHMLATKISQFGTRAGMPEGARLDITFPADSLPNAQYPEIATEKNVDTTTAQDMHNPLNIFPDTGGARVAWFQ